MMMNVVLLLLLFDSVLTEDNLEQLELNNNIRHGKSRIRLLRGRRHGIDFQENLATDNISNIILLDNKDSTTEDYITPVNNIDNLSIKINGTIKQKPKINQTKSNNTRKVTISSSSGLHANKSWQHVDRSMLFMGERALDQSDNKKKKKNKDQKNNNKSSKQNSLGKLSVTDDNEQINENDDNNYDYGNYDDDDDDDDDETTLEKLPEIVKSGHVDIVTRFLRIVESQHLLGENCTAGTDLNLGEGVVDRYAQERFRVEANVAVNRANMLTRLWKYADPEVVSSEYLLHASVFSMVEFDDDIFAAGNCYDQYQYKDYWLFCPYAYRLPEGTILVKDLAVEYKYLSNTSEWFYIARKNAEKVIKNYNQFSRGYNTYTYNETTHTERETDEILAVKYEDGKWSKPYYDCGGGNIWMLTYTVPFFGFQNNTYFFKGTSGIDIDLRRVDIDQCPLPKGSKELNIFAASDKCKKRTTECVAISGLGFRRGSYKCICKRGFFFPDVKAERRYYNGTVIEEEYEKLMLGQSSLYAKSGIFECLSCSEGCEFCEDDRPCMVSLNWVMRTVILVLSCVIICCLPIVVVFTWKYANVKVIRAASPVLLCFITLGALLIYCTIIVMYPRPNMYTCVARVWLREIGFSLTYGALMLKTWRISLIFHVRSAKAVKITDINLLKRLGIIVAIFAVFLSIRTLVAPPIVIVGRTADDLKAYLCRTDWWDHSFTTLEVLFLIWGIRLCIVVRKAPSEFNESRFISMAIYNEFLLSVFLNISMLFLQKPANPDLLYIIFFCHTQLTVTLLLCLIFGSKAYMVFKYLDQNDSNSGMMTKAPTSKFFRKYRSGNSHYASTNSSTGGIEYSNIQNVQDEFLRLYTQLQILKEKNMRIGNRSLASKITAMQEAARAHDNLPIDNNKTISKLNNTLDVVPEKPNNGSNPEDEAPVKIKRQSVTFAPDTDLDTINEDTSSVCKNIDDVNESCSSSGGASIELKPKDECNDGPSNDDGNSKYLKSGHAHTHDIVINLDDKSSITDEVTV